METVQLVLDPYQTFQAQWICNWMAVHCVKIILGKLILINLCRPALEVRFFMKHSVCNYVYRDRTYWRRLIWLRWELLMPIINLLFCVQLQTAPLCHRQVRVVMLINFTYVTIHTCFKTTNSTLWQKKSFVPRLPQVRLCKLIFNKDCIFFI